MMIQRIVLLLRKMADREKYFEGIVFRKICNLTMLRDYIIAKRNAGKRKNITSHMLSKPHSEGCKEADREIVQG